MAANWFFNFGLRISDFLVNLVPKLCVGMQDFDALRRRTGLIAAERLAIAFPRGAWERGNPKSTIRNHLIRFFLADRKALKTISSGSSVRTNR
jgi:hypothetical protein